VIDDMEEDLPEGTRTQLADRVYPLLAIAQAGVIETRQEGFPFFILLLETADESVGSGEVSVAELRRILTGLVEASPSAIRVEDVDERSPQRGERTVFANELALQLSVLLEKPGIGPAPVLEDVVENFLHFDV
jgi:hypothetical protein